MKIYVKNMACESCKAFVKEALEELDITPIKIELGEIETKKDVTDLGWEPSDLRDALVGRTE